ncbi:S8 family serine peptidase [Streptomyces sp. NBC_01718]|uniref:S8 family serine peptidase n=1 Tax=Streptomyces sp. NBC_01718 TaxID=2975919 RepID=UPI00352C506B
MAVSPAAAADAPIPRPLGAPAKTHEPKGGRHDKLGAHDHTLLQKAQSRKNKTVTVLLATPEDRTEAVRTALTALGGHATRVNDRLGYVRATVPTDKVEQLAALGTVTAIDLDEAYKVPDPLPVTQQDRKGSEPGTAAAPGVNTPAANPYLPTAETGAVDFAAAHPAWDGRGVTVGILDTGVDLGHPALQKTTTGERKIADWVTATDPVLEGDPTWLQMSSQVTVTDSTFKAGGATWTAPNGSYTFQTFAEGNTAGGDMAGDVNRDGDTSDRFGVLYRASDHTIWVDADGDRTFGDADIVRPYAEGGRAGHFGTDNPDTPVVESMPFTVEHRDNVDLSARGGSDVGKTADFVSIGITAESHGTHVAGIIAGNGLFGGKMMGAAPGAQIVSERVCAFDGGCSSYALTEGMIDAVVNKHVDVVNMSIGGLPTVNDGSDVRDTLYNRLIDEYGVQIFVASGNDGPGMNTVSDPSVATQVVSVGASVSKQTWWADYGSEVRAPQALFPFSSRGPREDGDLKPTLVAPGAAVSSVPMWQPGQPVPQAGYDLPAGYAMYNGTSMASPQATGAAALLLSAAGAGARKVTPAALRSALTSSAHFLKDEPAYAQGAGLVSVSGAWELLAKKGEPTAFDVQAPVCSVLAAALVTPRKGAGLYNRCTPAQGGQVPHKDRAYTVEVTRASKGSSLTRLSWLGNDGTFRAPGTVLLKGGDATGITVHAKADSTGAHSAVLRVDDPATPGVDKMVLFTVVVAADPAKPSYTVGTSGTSSRNRTTSLFVAVPEGAAALQLNLSRLADGSQTRFLAVDPQGLPVDSNASANCFTNYSDTKRCDPTARWYDHPMAGVWEFSVESRRTSPQLDTPYRLTAAVQGAAMTPPSAVVDETAVHAPVERTFTAKNTFAPVKAHAVSGVLGGLASAHPTLSDGALTGKTITVPRDATRLEIALGNASDPKADLDLYLIGRTGSLVGASTNGGARESIGINNPEPGYYTAFVVGTSVPSGSTTFDIQDILFSKSLGSVEVDQAPPADLSSGESLTVRGRLIADTPPPSGRQLIGRFSVATDRDAVIGSADVVVGKVTQPKVTVTSSFGPAVGFSLDDLGRVVGSKQQDGKSVPIRWDAEHGVTVLASAGGSTDSVFNQSRTAGLAVGQLSLPDGSARGGLWDASGALTQLPLPDWRAYSLDRAFAVNDSGTVVGNATANVRDPATGRSTPYNDPFTWTKDGGFTKLQHLTDNPSLTEPLAINNAGIAVGHSRLDGQRRAVKWAPDGTVTDLGVLPGMSSSYAQDVNSAGVIVGTSGDDAFVLQPGGTMKRLPDFGFNANALKVNDAGWMVGTAETAPDETTAVVWDPQGRMFDLGAMADAEHWIPTEGIGINNRNEVAFYAIDLTSGNNKIVIARL